MAYKPGRLSKDLRKALGIGEKSLAPWFPIMSKIGPPPAYPYMKIDNYYIGENEIP